MGVADRARTKMPQSGDYLDKDDLIRAQDEPFGVTSVIYDEHGSGYGPRWVLSLIPWFEDQEGPKGLLTFTANPTRNPFFEDLQAQIEENDNEPIGPLTVIKGKSQKGFRYYTLDDWKEDSGGATPAPAPSARPQRPAASETVSKPVEVPPTAAEEAPKPKRGRPRKDAASATPASTPAPSLPATREVGPGEAAKAQEVQLTRMAKVKCPDCGQEIEGRALPNEEGKLFVIHAFCPTLNRGTIVEVV